MGSLRHAKETLRKRALEKRGEIDPLWRGRAEEKICQSFFTLLCLREAETLLTYYPRKRETNVLPIATLCRQRGIRVAYPRCTEEKGIMTFHYVEDEAQDLEKGAFGLLEPRSTLPIYTPASDPRASRALCIVPGLLFDSHGGRLGYGGGYYDRFLCQFPGIRIGMTMSAFTVQEPLPHGRFDLPVHVLITEKGVTTVHAF